MNVYVYVCACAWCVCVCVPVCYCLKFYFDFFWFVLRLKSTVRFIYLSLSYSSLWQCTNPRLINLQHKMSCKSGLKTHNKNTGHTNSANHDLALTSVFLKHFKSSFCVLEECLKKPIERKLMKKLVWRFLNEFLNEFGIY